MKQCTSTKVEPLRNAQVNGYEHAGVVTHVCLGEEGHEGPCECGCGARWTKFGTVK